MPITRLARYRRLATLARSGLLDSPIDQAFDRLTRLAAQLLHAPVSLVSLVDEERQFFKSAFGLREPWLSMRETPLTHSFCKHVVQSAAPLVISNARESPLVRTNLAIEDLGVVAYAGIPLTLSTKDTLGSFCVIDSEPREWSETEIALLKDLTQSVITEIELRLSMHLVDELLEVTTHDLKNPLAASLMASDLILLQLRRHPVPEEVLANVRRVKIAGIRMQNIIQAFLTLHQVESGSLSLQLEPLALKEVVDDALKREGPLLKDKELAVTMSLPTDLRARLDRDKLGQALLAIFGYFIERSEPRNPLDVSLVRDDAACPVLRITNPRLSISDQEYTHLFDRTQTVASPVRKGTRLWLYLARELVDAHAGTLEPRRLETAGTSFEIRLPAA